MRPNKHWTRPDNGATRAKAPGRHGVVVGPSEEEEEGIGIAASDVVKVKGKDPVTPDCLRRIR